jgi:hypothetical protein
LICPDPRCNGNHGRRGPYADWCPADKEAHKAYMRAYQRRRYLTDPGWRQMISDYGAHYRATAAGMLKEMRHGAKRRGNR